MTFEDDFPSLKDCDNDSIEDNEMNFTRNEILSACLDKQKVNETVKAFQILLDAFDIDISAEDFFKKELELE